MSIRDLSRSDAVAELNRLIEQQGATLSSQQLLAERRDMTPTLCFRLKVVAWWNDNLLRTCLIH